MTCSSLLCHLFTSALQISAYIQHVQDPVCLNTDHLRTRKKHLSSDMDDAHSYINMYAYIRIYTYK